MGLMAARTVSDLANWDIHLDQQRHGSAQWHPSTPTAACDPYHTPLESQPFESFQSSTRISDQERAEQSIFCSNLERNSSATLPANARLPTCVDTTSSRPNDMHHSHHSSLSHTSPSKALPAPTFIASSTSIRVTPNPSVPTSRGHNSQPPPAREHVASLQLASTMESDIIDLTLDDTEDEVILSDVPVSDSRRLKGRRLGPNCRLLRSAHSSPVALEQSLFTPPPPSMRRRPRLLIDYLAVPSFPRGLTKADYRPISDHSVTPPPVPIVLKDSSLAEISVTTERPPTPSRQKWKGEEREDAMVQEHSRRAPAYGVDMIASGLLDAFYQTTIIPLQDVDTYPPLTNVDVAINSRFQFAHAWRTQASKLRKVELDCMSKLGLLGEKGSWPRLVEPPLPRMPGTTGHVSSEQLRPWELVLPDSSPQRTSLDHVSDEWTPVSETCSVSEVDPSSLSPPDDALPASSGISNLPASGDASNLPLPDPPVSQSVPSMPDAVEHDMNVYLNGLNDSPNKTVPPRPQLAPTYSCRTHVLQSGMRSQTTPIGLELPSLDLDLRLTHTADSECFLGVPPSSPPADTEPSLAPVSTSDSPFQPMSYLTASPSNVFGAEALPMDAWSFEQGESLLPDNDLPVDSHAAPIALGATIDPSLLGLEQSLALLPAPKDTAPRRRRKLPEPVIYVRRPVDSSALPMVSGRRPVQIKYRDAEDSPITPSTPSGSTEASSSLVKNPTELSTNASGDFPQSKRCPVPSRKLREYETASEPDSDYIPDTSKIKLKIKIKPKLSGSGKDKESIADLRDMEAGTAPQMSCCHQCRNTNARPKMLCSNMLEGRVCRKRFCNRCVLYRYPDITFDERSAGFLCPVCTNTCNCSLCSRGRGEEFVSMRLGGLAASILKTKVTLVRGASVPNVQRSASEPRTQIPEPNDVSPMQRQFWAHVYGTMGGEHVGSAFMTSEYMKQLQQPRMPSAPLSQFQPPLPAKTRRRVRREKKRDQMPKGPRVFIGQPLASWKVRAVRDLEPSMNIETAPSCSAPVAGSLRARRHRCYIGDRVPLHEWYGRMPGTPTESWRGISPAAHDSDGTPLPELEPEPEAEEGDDRDWPQPAVGECCSWTPGLPVSDPLVGEMVPAAVAPTDITVEMGATVVEQQPDQSLSTGSNSGLVSSGVGKDVDDGAGEKEMEKEPGQPPAPLVLSDEDLARAISAALTALAVDPQPSVQ